MPRLNDYLLLDVEGDQPVIRCRCGWTIGPATENYKLAVLCESGPVWEAGTNVNPHRVGAGRFVARRYACPGCLTLLDVEIALAEEPARWDIQPTVPTAGR
jgi:acetone carboxylase gamma subunit